MRKHAAIGLPIACLAVIAGYAAWLFYRGSKVGHGWASVLQVWPYLLAGVATVAAFMILMVWLAFYSDRRGYDQAAGREGR